MRREGGRPINVPDINRVIGRALVEVVSSQTREVHSTPSAYMIAAPWSKRAPAPRPDRF